MCYEKLFYQHDVLNSSHLINSITGYRRVHDIVICVYGVHYILSYILIRSAVHMITFPLCEKQHVNLGKMLTTCCLFCDITSTPFLEVSVVIVST